MSYPPVVPARTSAASTPTDTEEVQEESAPHPLEEMLQQSSTNTGASRHRRIFNFTEFQASIHRPTPTVTDLPATPSPPRRIRHHGSRSRGGTSPRERSSPSPGKRRSSPATGGQKETSTPGNTGNREEDDLDFMSNTIASMRSQQLTDTRHVAPATCLEPHRHAPGGFCGCPPPSYLDLCRNSGIDSYVPPPHNRRERENPADERANAVRRRLIQEQTSYRSLTAPTGSPTSTSVRPPSVAQASYLQQRGIPKSPL